MILALRTDKPEAEILILDSHGRKLTADKWFANRELSNTIHKKILEQLQACNSTWFDITAIIFYAGPGSFTGLRIGASVVNTLGESLGVPILGLSGHDWVNEGSIRIKQRKDDNVIDLLYEHPVKITKPRK